MRIDFVSVANPQLASFRYHILIPGQELTNRGHVVSVSKGPAMDADVYVFSKHYNPGDFWAVQGLRSEGKKTVFHCCDNHLFHTDKHNEHYRRMIGAVDKVIASTPAMATIIERETGVRATVIPDTYEFEEVKPGFRPSGRLKVLWYGSPTNLKDLIAVLPELSEAVLGVCTDPSAVEGSSPDVKFFPYSLDNLREAFKWCDAVIIPSSMGEDKIVKSHNRLVEAVRQGKFVVAAGLPSYKEFSKWMSICLDGESIGVGIDWMQDQKPDEIERRIGFCQQYIKSEYNPMRIGELWQAALSN